MTALLTKGLPTFLRTHAYHHVFDAATLLVALVLTVLLVETELLRARRSGQSFGRASITMTMPLAIVFFIVLVVRVRRFG